MIDPLSAAIGMFVGACIGIVAGTLRTGRVIDELREENAALVSRLRRLTTRGPGGRFAKPDK